MNKTELIELMSEKAEVTKASAARVLEAFIDCVTTAVKKSDPVIIPNFISIVVKKRAARKGRNPATGAEIEIKEANVVGFKAGKGLKEAAKVDKLLAAE